MQDVSASSLTAIPPQTRSNSSRLVTSSWARSSSMASTAAARGVSLASTRSRQSSPVRASNRNRPKPNCRCAATCELAAEFLGEFPELPQYFPDAGEEICRTRSGRPQSEEQTHERQLPQWVDRHRHARLAATGSRRRDLRLECDSDRLWSGP